MLKAEESGNRGRTAQVAPQVIDTILGLRDIELQYHLGTRAERSL